VILTLRVRPMLALVPFIFSFGAGLPASAQQARAMVITTTPTSSPTPMPSPTVTVPTPVTVTSTLTPDLSLAPSPTITLTTPSAPSPTIMPTTPSPTTITATRVTSTPTITMHTPSRSRIVSSSMAGTCPSGWTCADIGTPSLAGDQSLSGDTWTVSGAGTDIWGSADQFRYVWQNLGGDVSVTARALSQSNTGTHAKAGVMLRGSADPGAMFYYFQVEPGGTYYVTYRSGQGTMAQIAASFAGGLPYYVRVARAGDMFTAYTSGDGATWTAVPNSSVTLYMGHTQPILGGLAVSSTDPGTLGTATFGQVAVAASANSGPSVCPTGWQCADIGNPDLSGGQAISGSAVTIDGGGRDIWGSADQFRYIWQSFTSDATVSARITMQTHTSDYAKAGIMFRASADSGAPFYFFQMEPVYCNVCVTVRSSAGTVPQIVVMYQAPLPYYMRVTRSGNTFTAYTSKDGAAWAAVPGSTATLPASGTQPILGGLAVSGDDDGVLGTSTFDHVIPQITLPPVTLAMQGGNVPWHPHYSARLAEGLGASVDLADGHVDVSAHELHLPARGPALAMGQTWDSVAAQTSVTTTAGQGWSSSLSPSIGGAITGTLTFTDDTGAAWPLTYTGSLSADGPYTAYSPPPGMPWQLTVATAPTTAYTLTDFLTGATMSFDGQGRLAATGDAYGNENRLQFTGDPGPSSMVNDGGRSMRFLYGTNGLLSDVKSPLWVSGGSGQAGSQHVAYDYAPGTTQLQTITTAAGTGQDLTTTFGYSGALLTRVTTPYTPITHTWSIAYDAQGRVASISSPVSGTTGQLGSTPAYTTAFTYTPGRTVVVEGYGTTAALTTTYDLDAHGQPIAVTDGLTNRTASAYDQNHDITRVTDARGNVTTNAYAYVGPYGSAGLVTETDQPGIAAYIPTNATSPVTTTYRYDPTTYDLLERDTAEGARTVYSYDGPRHQVTSVIDRLSSLSPCRQSFAVAQARPSRTISGAHAHPSRTISGAHKSRRRHRKIAPRVQPHTDCAPTGDRWRGTITAYDAWGQLVATTDARGVIVPDTSIGQTPVATLNPTPPIAATRTYTYTPAGDLWSVSSPPLTTLNPSDAGQTTGPVTTTYGYDADGNQLTVTSPNGAVTTAGYDHLGRLTQLAQPTTMLFDNSVRAPTATIDYDGDGNVVRTTDGAGDPTTRAYDPLGRLTSSTNAVDETTVLTYTATRLSQVRTPAGNLTSYTYDAAGRRTGVTDPVGTLTQFGLDAVGNTTAITVPLDTHGASSVEARTYDGLNQLVTDSVGGTGELTATAAQTTTYSYDHDGNLVQAQAPNGDVTYRTYDYADQPRAVTVYPSGALAPVSTPPPAASQTFALDPAGHLTDQLDFNQRDHAYTLDGAGRVTQRVDSYSGQTLTAITTTVGYDPNGNVRALSRQADGVSGTQTQASTATYNALDWLTSQNDGQGATTYGYDAAGRPRTQSLLGGAASVTATLDAAGRTTEIDDNATGPVATSLFSYTLDDRPYTATLGAGASVAVGETRLHDANDRLTQLTWSVLAPGSSPLTTTYAYSYTPQGRTFVATRRDNLGSGGAFQYTPDAYGRLFEEVPSDVSLGSLYRYDGNNNLTEIDQSTNLNVTQKPVIAYSNTDGSEPTNWLPNELISVTHNGDFPAGNQGTTSYAYDNAGNTTAITYPTGSSDALTYDAAARLVAIQRGDGTGLAITYNARGQRASYTITRTGQTAPLFAETFTYRGGHVGQVVVTGTALTAPLTQTYLYRQDGTPLELLQQTGSGAPQRYWYVVDGKGNVTGLIDGATGQLVCQYGYDAWGKPVLGARDEEGYNVHQPLRYRGYWYDGWGTDTTGTWDSGPWRWYGLPARPYDPDLKRFLQPDPSSQDGVRSYVYCHDAPLDCADPSGLTGGEGGGEPGAGPEPGGVLSPEAQAQADVQILRGSTGAAIDSVTSPGAAETIGAINEELGAEPYAILDLSDGWQESVPNTSYRDKFVYALMNMSTDGESNVVLKAGKTSDTSDRLIARFRSYARAGRNLRLQLRLTIWKVEPGPGENTHSVEGRVRRTLLDLGHKLPWDNNAAERLGRPGAGTPYENNATARNNGWEWVNDPSSEYHGQLYDRPNDSYFTQNPPYYPAWKPDPSD